MGESPDIHTPPQEPTYPPAMQRAEVLVDVAAQRLGHWGAVVGQQLRKVAALAREEGEDIWAEAQAIRHDSAQPATHAGSMQAGSTHGTSDTSATNTSAQASTSATDGATEADRQSAEPA